jgi:hypothetical protein
MKKISIVLFLALSIFTVPLCMASVDDVSPPPIEWADQAVISQVSSIQVLDVIDITAFDAAPADFDAVMTMAPAVADFGILEDPVPIRSTPEIHLSSNWKNWPSGKPRTVYRHLDHYDRC